MKKCYVAIIGDEDGKVIGTVMARGWFWFNAYDVHEQLGNSLSKGAIIMDFKRIK
jgi:hypothetical protein